MEITTIIEPFRIKSVELLSYTTRSEREKYLHEAGYNLFKIPADKVLIDLLTDSGTGAMSTEQWAGMMRGDESYAGAKSYFAFEKVVKMITGYEEILPVHQGRAAERILFGFVGEKNQIIPSNSHFDTTRANIENRGIIALDLPVPEALDFEVDLPFKGNMDVAALEELFKKHGREAIPLVMLTLTNNALGGQPVSMANIKAVRAVCNKYDVPFFLDVARFAENAYFIKLREPGYENKSPLEIANEIFSLADGCMMSAKKDGMVNIGGFLAMNRKDWAKRAREISILGEGFPTYGGLSGRDLEAIACGLLEALDEKYLQYRLHSTAYVGKGLKAHGVPIVEPPGGHAIYVNAAKLLPHIPAQEYPGQVLACALYLETGIRSVEIGSLMCGKWVEDNTCFLPAPMELVRLAFPRRVYTQSHMDYVIEAIGLLAKQKDKLRGLKIVEASPVLTHFTARLEPV